jgi:hypothetical protein
MMITEKVKANVWSNKEIERFKAEHFQDYNAVARERSATGLAQRENNDCVVKSFMMALDLSYDQAHAYIKKEMKREDGKGTYTSAFAKHIVGRTKNGKKITFIGAHPTREWMQRVGGSTKKVLANKQYKKPTGYTVKSFMENNPVGRFVLIVEGHAVAVINGVLHGNHNEQWKGLYRSVWYGFEMK